MRMGSLKNSNDVLITQRKITWTNEPVNVLGIWVGTDPATTEQLNFGNLLDKSKMIMLRMEKSFT